MINPYTGTNWRPVLRVGSATHMHMPDQETLDNGYRYGIRHFPMSNYYPSAPYGAGTRASDFRLRQSWGAKCDGTPLDPPINWNDIITWQEELEEPYKAEFPFTESEPVFSDIPEDVILSHNAEHHSFTNSRSHICSPGSSFASGTFDVRGHYHLAKHGVTSGFGGTWQEGFGGMLQGLDYPDAGGITICHPTWFSRFSDEDVLEMLDFDERVLGIEVYNDYSCRKDWAAVPDYKAPPESEPGFSLNMWDRILATGRNCWGFCVPDHSVRKGGNWHGRNVLLVPRFTEHDCLRAYRTGSFYGCLKDNGLTVTAFEATSTSVSVTTNSPAEIKFITDRGPTETVRGNRAAYDIPVEDGKPQVVYVRVEISDESGERLFLQPVIYQPRQVRTSA